MATNPACLDAIRALIAVLRDRNISYVIIGGAALQLHYGIISVRTTADVDTIVLVDTWEEYDGLLSDLQSRGWASSHEHEYRRHAPGGCIVDLMPYPIHEARGENHVVLPQSKGKLSTIGWLEALTSAEETYLDGIGLVRVPPPQHLAAIKAAAWYERGATKDAYDFITLCRRFGTGDALIVEVTAGRSANATQARAMLLARAIVDAVPAGRPVVHALAKALADRYGALVSILRAEFERETNADEFRREMTDIATGLFVVQSS